MINDIEILDITSIIREYESNSLSGVSLEEKNDGISAILIYSDDRLIYRLTSSSCSYIYKTKGNSQKSSDEFQIEYQLLNKIWDMADNKKVQLNIPRPLALINNSGFVMTDCPGLTLKKLYQKSLYFYIRRQHVKRVFKDSALLLSRIHGVSIEEKEYLSIYKNRLKNLDRMINEITKKLDDEKVISILRNIRKFFIKVHSNNKSGSVCLVHGNFAMRNLLHDGIEAYTIDLEDSKNDLIYYDLGLLIAELLSKNILLFNKNYNLALIKSFTKAYSEIKSIEGDSLNSYVLYHLVWSFYEVTNRPISKNMFKNLITYIRRGCLLKEMSILLLQSK